MKAAVAEDEGGRCGNPFADLQVGSPDEDRELVQRSGSRLAVRPGHECRIDPIELIFHRLDDRATWTGKLGERESHEMAGPPAVYPVDDHSRVAVDDLPGDGINSADPIVLVDSRLGFGWLRRLISLGLVLVGLGMVDLMLV
jgi:hypothetical protein